MAVAFDAKSTAWTNVSGVATLSHSLITVGSGTNMALIACIIFSATALPAGLTVTWDLVSTNQAMTAIASTTISNSMEPATAVLYGLVAPTSGNKTLTMSWTGNLEAHLVAVSFSGVDQTGGSTSFPNGTTVNSTSGAATSGSITVTSASADQVVALFSNNAWAFATTSGNIIQFQNNGPNDGSVASYSNGASSVVCTCSGGIGATYVASACDILAAVAASGTGLLIGHG